VQDEIEEIFEPIHRAKTAHGSVIGRTSATKMKKTVRRINLNVPNSNRVYTFERTSKEGNFRKGLAT
jgi:hypothetical protein